MTPAAKAALYNLKTDIGEAADVAAEHPETAAQLQTLVDAMKGDLGLDGPAPGSRALGKVEHAEPLIGFDGKTRAGFEPR